jgi:hypothetical protein
MERIGDDLLMNALERREDQIHEATDAIDAKAGLVLAAAAFLAVQPAVLLVVSSIPKQALFAQFASFVALCFAVWFAHKVLEIQGYLGPGFSEEWRDGIVAAAPPDATESTIRSTLLWGLINQINERLADGIERNERKLDQLTLARKCTMLSWVLNLAVLVLILISRLS